MHLDDKEFTQLAKNLQVYLEREINLFCEMISLSDNFEIYPVSENTIRFSAVFQNALTNIG